jgi:hypothetical protein
LGNSDRWRERVWRHQLGPAEKLVALAIAEHANALGECYPGRARIAAMTGLSERTVTRSLGKLGEILRVTQTRGRPGKNTFFQFVENGTQCPIKNETERPFQADKRDIHSTGKETSTPAKRDIGDKAYINHSLNHLREPGSTSSVCERCEGRGLIFPVPTRMDGAMQCPDCEHQTEQAK